jgi:ring-1,2-phenylacetyl-CoA epoxidase subunit PaaB
MTSTQWPVYQVFERPAHGRPMRAGGSVHAVDAETALQNAWAVYGRRPTAVGLWVVPRRLVLMKTKEEVDDFTQDRDNRAASDQSFYVFCRSGAKLVYEEAPQVVAPSPEQAMVRAVAGLNDCFACWVFPAAAVTSTESQTAECSFAPQHYKWFRDHKSFPIVAMLREIRADASERKHA